MMKNNKLLYVIDSFAIGGAEMLYASTINELANDYDITLVYFEPRHDLCYMLNNNVDIICLNCNPKKNFFSAVFALKKIIINKKIDIVHTSLFWSTLISRLATPSRVKLVFTLQNLMSHDTFNSSWIALILEKITYKKEHILIAVSEEVIKDYKNQVGIKGPAYILYNPINGKYFLNNNKLYDFSENKLKLVAVGNLRSQKNYQYLLEAFKLLKGLNVSIDVYGEGSMRQELQSIIDENDLKVVLKGHTNDLVNILPTYDAYVMTSKFEGYGIAIVEAMAMGLPVILSNIPVLREVVGENAVFFNPNNPVDLSDKLQKILKGEININKLSVSGYKRALKIGSKDIYMTKIRAIYSDDFSNVDSSKDVQLLKYD